MSGRRLALDRGTGPSDYIDCLEAEYIRKRVMPMVSYPDLIQFVMMLTAFATLIIKLCEKEITAPSQGYGYFKFMGYILLNAVPAGSLSSCIVSSLNKKLSMRFNSCNDFFAIGISFLSFDLCICQSGKFLYVGNYIQISADC